MVHDVRTTPKGISQNCLEISNIVTHTNGFGTLTRQSIKFSHSQSGPNLISDCDQKIQRLKDMGISELEARAVLSKENWNLEKATENLFS